MTKLSEELHDAIDGGEECRGRDTEISRWIDQAERLERQRDELVTALRNLVEVCEGTIEPYLDDYRAVIEARAALVKVNGSTVTA